METISDRLFQQSVIGLVVKFSVAILQQQKFGEPWVRFPDYALTYSFAFASLLLFFLPFYFPFLTSFLLSFVLAWRFLTMRSCRGGRGQ